MTDKASSVLDESIAEGIVREQRDGAVVLAIPGTDYRLGLELERPLDAPDGAKTVGRIRAQANRIDVIKSGGRYIEPVEGRPRRIQGRVIGVDEANDEVLVKAVVPIICRTNEHQRATMFQIDQMVSFDVAPGARFEPAP